MKLSLVLIVYRSDSSIAKEASKFCEEVLKAKNIKANRIKSDFYADNLVRFGGGYLLSKDLQLDSAVTFNFKDSPSVFGLNFGVSYRIDRHRDEPKASKGTSAKKEEKRRARAQKRAKKKKVDNFDEN